MYSFPVAVQLQFVFVGNEERRVQITMAGQNFKGLLQELFQKSPQGPCRPPEYREIEKTGDPHMPVHTILLTAVWKGRELRVEKSARKKLDAEKEAAKEMYEMILQGVPASSAVSRSPIGYCMHKVGTYDD